MRSNLAQLEFDYLIACNLYGCVAGFIACKLPIAKDRPGAWEMNYFAPRIQTLGDLLDLTSSAGCGEELKETVVTAAEASGFPKITYHMIAADGLVPPIATHFTSYPAEWVGRYIATNVYFRDPVIRHGQSAVTPYAWDWLEAKGIDAAGRTVFGEASEFGVAHGLSVPVRGPRDLALVSMCPDSISRKEAARLIKAKLADLTILSMMAHERARVLLKPQSVDGKGVRLSKREREVMQWIACGKSSWDIGMILNLSEATVRNYTAAALGKLNCHDRTHAAVRAVVMGLIDPPY